MYVLSKCTIASSQEALMRTSSRAFAHRIITYPVLFIMMGAYAMTKNKAKILDAFYLIRGLPHGFIRDGNRLAFYDGLTIVFPLKEDPSFDDVWLRDVYYPYKPKTDDIVIDVGAHMGFFTLKIAKNVKMIIAVEPDPTNFRFLVLNIKINQVDKKVAAYNVALGDANRQMFLDRTGYGGGRSKITSQKTDIQVKTQTLDSLVETVGLDHVDLIKIDTEGNELSVIRGAQEVLRRYRPDLLVASYHFPKELHLVANQLRRNGYRVFYYSVPLVMAREREAYLYAKAFRRDKG